jgi:hypothetical protein
MSGAACMVMALCLIVNSASRVYVAMVVSVNTPDPEEDNNG